jgi:hypothetical protein
MTPVYKNAASRRRRAMLEAVRWYERTRWPYAADRRTADEYATWLKLIPWTLFGTFTFAWKVSDPQAAKVFDEFIDRLERNIRCDVAHVRGDEKRLSGCGKPASGRHFHVLMASAAPVGPSFVEGLWMSMAGTRSDGAGAQVQAYDASLNGASYVLKLINRVDGDWAFRKLHLVHPSVSVGMLNLRQRRNLRRHEARKQSFGCAQPDEGHGGPLATKVGRQL